MKAILSNDASVGVAAFLAGHSCYACGNASQLTQELGPEGLLNYSYDPVGQLVGVTGARTESFAWDPAGNPINLQRHSVGAGNRLASGSTGAYQHDDEGNMTRWTTFDSRGNPFTINAQYDHRNRLVSATRENASGTIVGSASYTYDALGRRVGMVGNPDGEGTQAATQTWTTFDGADVYADYTGNGSLSRDYLVGPAIDMMLARSEGGSGNASWYLTDRLGSVREVVSAQGTTVSEKNYSAFGSPSAQTSFQGDRFGYTGREFDSSVGLQFNRARTFDPSIQRWTSQDPLGFAAGDGNLYRYVGNNPVSFIDPTGLEIETYGLILHHLPERGSISANTGYFFDSAPPKNKTLEGIPYLRKKDLPFLSLAKPMVRVQGKEGRSGVMEEKTFVGPWGIGSCVGIVLIPPKKTQPTFVMHLTAGQRTRGSLEKIGFFVQDWEFAQARGLPKKSRLVPRPGYRAVICGAEAQPSNPPVETERLQLLSDAVKVLKELNVEITGYVVSPNCMVDQDGKIYWLDTGHSKVEDFEK